jgi:DNA-binding transcriptional ArsR family regulator
VPYASPQEARRLAGIFKVLSHPDRVRIACLLTDGRSATQRELLEELHWPQSTLARHVSTLRERGLLRATRRGNDVYLELASDLPARLLAAAGELSDVRPSLPSLV